MVDITNCQLILQKKVSKNGKEYCALYIVIDKEEIFLTFVNEKIFDKLSK